MLTENLAAMIEEAPFAYAFHQLIVDDSEMNQLLFQRLVLQLYPKAKIHLAAGGSDAIALSINDEIDLILMDIQMFEIDGIKATAHIREFEKKSNTHIPIIGITAGNVLSTRDECLKAGMDDFMIKPIDGSKFKATLEHFLGGKFSSTDLDTSDVIVVPKLLDYYSQRSNSRLQSGVLTGFKVPGAERNIHCRLSYQVSAVHEEGVLVRGPHYISRGATIQIKSPVLNDIFSQDRPYQFIVDDVEADEKEENFFTLRLLLVGPDQKLVGKFREYLRQKNS